MKAVILAAGRGSRMGERTANQPKFLTVLAGRPLLHWQLSALSAAGAGPTAVVVGYRGELIERGLKTAPAPFDILENPRWAESNMLTTLACAEEWVGGEECLVSYSDIVYPAGHAAALALSASPVAITYDTDWKRLWEMRNGGNPLIDAETFRTEDGRLREIGGKPESLEQVRGQYMGLLKLAPDGWRIWRKRREALGGAADRTDATGFLRLLLADGVEIGAVPVSGAWCEVDSGGDLALYEAALAKGGFSHDWRR